MAFQGRRHISPSARCLGSWRVERVELASSDSEASHPSWTLIPQFNQRSRHHLPASHHARSGLPLAHPLT